MKQSTTMGKTCANIMKLCTKVKGVMQIPRTAYDSFKEAARYLAPQKSANMGIYNPYLAVRNN